MSKDLEIFEDSIKDKIYTIRGVHVILDEDLAELYEVEVRSINQAVKRNNERFPDRFLFKINKNEYEILKSQIVIPSWGGKRTNPYAFTEQGVAMLSSVLRSKKAIEVNIKIIDTFVQMREFLQSNSKIFPRLDSLEKFKIESVEKFDKIFDYMSLNRPKQGIFFDGQAFEAHKFILDLINTSKKSIILIDNYIDETVLELFCDTNINVIIYTAKISKKLQISLNKYNSQYKPITVKEFDKSHDRFLIIDNKEIYHFGASLKDLGKRWFAFSKFDKEAFKIIDRLK